MSLHGKVALVTGSTSGIGLGIAMAEQGADIMMNGSGDPTQIDQLRRGIANDCRVRTAYSDADISKPAAIATMIQSDTLSREAARRLRQAARDRRRA